MLVIWKLDRLGRSLKHLVTLTSEFMEQEVGLISLNDPIDTTTPLGWGFQNPHATPISDIAVLRLGPGRLRLSSPETDELRDNQA